MAILLPFAVLVIFLIIGVVIAFGFAVLSNKRRYHRIINRLRTGAGEQEAREP